MVAVAPPQIVEGSPRVRLPYGLSSVVNFRTPSDPHWGLGISWQHLPCEPAGGLGAIQCDPLTVQGIPKTFVEENLTASAVPFGVYGSHYCRATGSSIADGQRLAGEHLESRGEQRAEQALWTGDLGNTPNLRGAATIGTALDIVDGLGRLEDHIATEYGSLGVIHMTRAAALKGLAENALESEGDVLRTQLGTPVIAGAGYDGSSPEGVAPAAGTTWIYVTPLVFGFRSAPLPGTRRNGDGLNLSTNEMYAIVEQTYLLAYDDCGEGAVSVDLTA